MQRWHIWNTIWDVQPLNLLWAVANCKRICAGMCVCACLSYVCVCACVCQREQPRLWLILQQKPLRGEMEQTKLRQEGGGTWCCADWLWFPTISHTRTHAHTHTYTHTYNLCIHLPLPAHMLAREEEDRGEGENMLPPNPHPSSPTMDCSLCSRLVWSLNSICLHVWTKKRQSMTKTHWQINILYRDGSLLFWVTWKKMTGTKKDCNWTTV